LLDGIEAQAARLELRHVDLDADLALAAAVERHRGDAGDRFERALEPIFRHLLQLIQGLRA
jgi:hypothetical protein